MWIVLIICASLVFGVFLLVCFRKIVRRQLSQKISGQVNELVNQYIAMYEGQRFGKETGVETELVEKKQGQPNDI